MVHKGKSKHSSDDPTINWEARKKQCNAFENEEYSEEGEVSKSSQVGGKGGSNAKTKQYR